MASRSRSIHPRSRSRRRSGSASRERAMANEFEGRQFVITGGAGGIGRACARDLLARGARVLLVDIDTGRLDQVKNELGGGDRLAAYVSRIASPAEAAAALEA